MTATSDVESSGRRARRGLPARMLVMAVVPVAAVVGLHYYIGRRMLDDAGLTGAPALLGWVTLATLFGTFLASTVLARSHRKRLAVASAWVSHLWVGAFALLLVSLLFTDVLRWTAMLLLDGGSPFADRAWLGRVQAGVVLLLVLAGLGWGFRTARGAFRVERVEVPIEGLPPEFDGFRIAQVSDIHIGQTLDGRFLQRVVAQVNALDADVVAVTGDLVDGYVSRIAEEVAPLAGLRAKERVYYVTGNHEYYYDGPAWEAEVRRLGLTVLHNQHRVHERGVARLVIGGVPDHDAAQFGDACRPDLAFASAPAGAPRVLLAHQPRTALKARGQRVALQLSGHTHGGQFFPWMFFVRLQQPVVSGLERLGDGWVYTSRGTGYWGPPLRLGPTPEVTELTLRRATA